jgi:hypothetical protein
MAYLSLPENHRLTWTTKREKVTMATTTKIHVTAADNELYGIVSQQPTTSSEIFHIKSGFGAVVDYTVSPQSILPHGNYTLILIGINWGGPQAFKVTLTTGGIDTIHAAPTSGPVGANWTLAIPIIV